MSCRSCKEENQGTDLGILRGLLLRSPNNDGSKVVCSNDVSISATTKLMAFPKRPSKRPGSNRDTIGTRRPQHFLKAETNATTGMPELHPKLYMLTTHRARLGLGESLIKQACPFTPSGYCWQALPRWQAWPPPQRWRGTGKQSTRYRQWRQRAGCFQSAYTMEQHVRWAILTS